MDELLQGVNNFMWKTNFFLNANYKVLRLPIG